MSNWITHLMVADRVLEALPELCRHEYCVGNIAPDCNVENADWTAFTPPRQVTHWMNSERKCAADCNRFVQEYMLPRTISQKQEEDFLWGYYTHLVVDAEFQRTTRDEARVGAAWGRIMAHPELGPAAAALPPTWDSVKQLIGREERMRDVLSLERDYLDAHPDTGFLTEIVGLETFPDYLDFLPPNAIPRKVRVMGGIPQRAESRYPWLAMTKEEYLAFVERAVQLSLSGIRHYRSMMRASGRLPGDK